MTDLAKAREIAKMILSRKPEQAVVYNAEVLAQAFLALSEKCERYREALLAITGMPEDLLDLKNAKYVARSSLKIEETLIGAEYVDGVLVAKNSTLEPGDSDG